MSSSFHPSWELRFPQYPISPRWWRLCARSELFFLPDQCVWRPTPANHRSNRGRRCHYFVLKNAMRCSMRSYPGLYFSNCLQAQSIAWQSDRQNRNNIHTLGTWGTVEPNSVRKLKLIVTRSWDPFSRSKQMQKRDVKTVYQDGRSILETFFPPCLNRKSRRNWVYN